MTFSVIFHVPKGVKDDRLLSLSLFWDFKVMNGEIWAFFIELDIIFDHTFLFTLISFALESGCPCSRLLSSNGSLSVPIVTWSSYRGYFTHLWHVDGIVAFLCIYEHPRSVLYATSMMMTTKSSKSSISTELVLIAIIPRVTVPSGRSPV